jgi:hypothetical protein
MAGPGATDLQELVQKMVAAAAQGPAHKVAADSFRKASAKLGELQRKKVQLDTKAGQLRVQLRGTEEALVEIDQELVKAQQVQEETRESYSEVVKGDKGEVANTGYADKSMQDAGKASQASSGQQATQAGLPVEAEQSATADLEADPELEQALSGLPEQLRQKIKAREHLAAQKAAKKARTRMKQQQAQTGMQGDPKLVAEQVELLQQAAWAFGKVVQSGLGNGNWRSTPYPG